MKHAPLAVAVAALALLSFFQFPGHTWLQSDTQIFAPILERLWDPTTFPDEILVDRPHVSYTVYDEMTLAARRITGLGFREVLASLQVLFRAAGILGVYLMASSLGLTFWPSLLITGLFSLGATVLGPTVLLVEYEPVPRGFALPLLFLGAGLIAHGRAAAAGCAGACGFLLHAPTVFPFWAIYLFLALRRRSRGYLLGLAALAAAALMLLIAARVQPLVGETQSFFTRLDPLQEKLQRMRAPYVYISIWAELYWKHYLAASLVAFGAYWRIRRHAPADFGWFLWGLPALGLISMPLSFLLLETWKWALIPQVQPMRAVLFLAALAIFNGAAAACFAIKHGRPAEAWLWLVLAIALPASTRYDVWPARERWMVTLALAAAACLGLWLYRRGARAGAAAVAAVVIASYFALPGLGGIVTSPELDHTSLLEMARWARRSTPRDAVFLFPEAGRGLDPGIFRANALRTVYVDWKGGGQVNYLKDLGELWWTRWQAVAPYNPGRLDDYRRMGIDYLVLTKSRLPVLPAFDNGRYRVYSIGGGNLSAPR